MCNQALVKALVRAAMIVVLTNVKSIITTPSIKFYRSFSILQEYYTKKESRFARFFLKFFNICDGGWGGKSLLLTLTFFF